MAKRQASPLPSGTANVVTPAVEVSGQASFTVPDTVIKGQAKRLLAEMRRLAPGTTLSQAQAALARVWNEADWHTLNARRVVRPPVAPALAVDAAEATPEPWSLTSMDPDLLNALLERWFTPTSEGMWPARAAHLVQSVVPTLVALLAERHEGRVAPLQLSDALSLATLFHLASRRTLQPEAQQKLWSYLRSLPHFPDANTPGWFERNSVHDLPNATHDMHGHLLMLVRIPLNALERLAPLLNTVVWRQEWRPILSVFEDPVVFGLRQGNWLDREERFNLLTSPLLRGSQPVVRLVDLVNRLATTLSEDEAASLHHWLNKALHPTFLPTLKAMGTHFSAYVATHPASSDEPA